MSIARIFKIASSSKHSNFCFCRALVGSDASYQLQTLSRAAAKHSASRPDVRPLLLVRMVGVSWFRAVKLFEQASTRVEGTLVDSVRKARCQIERSQAGNLIKSSVTIYISDVCLDITHIDTSVPKRCRFL